MQHHTYSFKAMGTRCEVQLYAPDSAGAAQASKAVQDDVARLESKYSRYLDTSLLTAINRAAHTGDSLTVDSETARLLDYAATCFEQSDGLFDISSGLLRQAWNFRAQQLPDPAAVETLLSRIGWHKLQWQSPTLHFPLPGMELDLGGVVKEYAADRAATLCEKLGIRHGLINLGGDIRIIGPHPDGSPWRIGIQHPQRPGEILQMLELSAGALASSGDYERCIIIDGVRYSHVLNPLTGWPVKALTAVSVAADFCVLAGSAATIAMLKDHEGKQWLRDLGLPYLWVDGSGASGGSLL